MARKEHSFLTICLNKSGNKKRTSRSFLVLFSVIGSFNTESSLTYLIPVFVVLCLNINENIDQMHKSIFFSFPFIEI